MRSIARSQVIKGLVYIKFRKVLYYIMYRDRKTSQALGNGIVTVFKVIGIVIALPIYILIELSKMQK